MLIWVAINCQYIILRPYNLENCMRSPIFSIFGPFWTWMSSILRICSQVNEYLPRHVLKLLKCLLVTFLTNFNSELFYQRDIESFLDCGTNVSYVCLVVLVPIITVLSFGENHLHKRLTRPRHLSVKFDNSDCLNSKSI